MMLKTFFLAALLPILGAMAAPIAEPEAEPAPAPAPQYGD